MQKIGFHQGSFGGEVYTSGFRETYNAAGLSKSFVDKALSTPPSSVWWPTLDELVKAGVVTQVAPLGTFAASGFGPDPTAASVVAELDSVPIFAALKKRDAEHWPEIEAAWVRDALLGQPVTDFMSLARARISATARRLRPMSPDDVILAVANIILKEIPVIQAKDPEACWSYLTTGEVNLEDYLSSDLIAQESAVTSRTLLGTPAAPAPPTNEAAGDKLLRTALEVVQKDGGNPSQILANLQPGAPHCRFCPAFYALYHAAVTLPASDAAALSRNS